AENERLCPAPEPVVVDAHDAIEPEIARDIPVEIDEDAAADELGEAARGGVTLSLGAGCPIAEAHERVHRSGSIGRTDEQIEIGHRPQLGRGVHRMREDHALEREGLYTRLTERA